MGFTTPALKLHSTTSFVFPSAGRAQQAARAGRSYGRLLPSFLLQAARAGSSHCLLPPTSAAPLVVVRDGMGFLVQGSRVWFRVSFMLSETNNVSEATSPNSNEGSCNEVLGGRIRQPQLVYIYWDMENCPVPHGVQPNNVAINVRNVLRKHPEINGVVRMFSAYADFSKFPRRVREGCHETGVTLIDVPSGRKNSADNAIIVDMLGSIRDNPPPAYVMLISGDVDFALALHKLDQFGYTIILAIPANVSISSSLYKAGKFVLYWPSLACGENSLPPATSILHNSDIKGPQCSSEPIKLLDDETSVHHSDIQVLKRQLVALVERSGGSLTIERLQSKYYKQFKEHLHLARYGKDKLVDLLEMMSDVMIVEGEGRRKFIRLHHEQGPTFHKNDKKGKGALDDDITECGDATYSSDDLSVWKGREKSIHLHSKQGPTFLGNDKKGKGVLDDNIAERGDVACSSYDFLNKWDTYTKSESPRSWEKEENSKNS